MTTPPDHQRYHRQTLLPGIGPEGQRRLASSHALLVGCGALGTVIADLLVRAGVGTLTLVDRDIVELTNLQRQTLFDEADAREGAPKAAAAASRLSRVNSGVRIRPVIADFNHRGVQRLLDEAAREGGPIGVLLDGTDNFSTRYLLNDLAVRDGLPLVYGGAVGTVGMSMTVRPGDGPCLRCIFETPPPPGSTPTCDTAGVFAPVTASIGALQAAEAIRILAGAQPNPAPGTSVLHELDLWHDRRRRVTLHRRVPGDDEPGCPCCVHREFPFLAGELAVGSTVLCGRNSVQINPPLDLLTGRLDLAALADRLRPHGRFELTRFHLRGTLNERRPVAGDDDGETSELVLTLFPDGRAIVQGTTDAATASAVYARFVGI